MIYMTQTKRKLKPLVAPRSFCVDVLRLMVNAFQGISLDVKSSEPFHQK